MEKELLEKLLAVSVLNYQALQTIIMQNELLGAKLPQPNSTQTAKFHARLNHSISQVLEELSKAPGQQN